MTSKQLMVPELNDLMKWHLYIGYCQENKQPVRSLYELFRSQGLACCLRSSLDATELSTKQNIEEEINFSHKCLLYVSPAYMKDCWSRYELEEAGRKLKYLGKKAVVAVIEPSVDKCHLERFSEFTQIHLQTDQTIFSETFLEEHNFLSEFELKPTLSTIPKSNIGVGVALTYFYGFLQLHIPGITKNLGKELGQHDVNWNCVVKKMLIIIPESVNSPPKLTEPGFLEQTGWTLKEFACRSGREMREYTIPVYKLTPADVQDAYYFVGDIPACLFAVREAYDRQSAGLSKSELYQARNEFCLTLKGLLDHPDNISSYAHQWEMLVWPDAEENANRKKLSEFLCQQIRTKHLTEIVQVQIDGPVQATSETETYLRQKGIHHSSVYRGASKYQLKPHLRGICVIINNSEFSNTSLIERSGAKEESDNLKNLFSELHFEVHVHADLNATEMRTCLESYQRRDHSMYDAFVCCILSHGTHGYICSRDGVQVKILSLMELFYENACLSLQGKPKLFFIGACQTEESNAASASSGVEETGGAGLFTNAAPESPTNADLVPASLDFIVSYATLPKRVAYAHPEFGGIYVRALCKHLNTDNEIDIALKMVCSEVKGLLSQYSEKHNADYSFQEPFHMCITGNKLLFLCGEM